MNIDSLLTRTVTLRRRSGTVTTDRYGNESKAPVETEVQAEIQQRQRSENDELGTGEWLGIFPAGTDLTTADSIDDPRLGRFELDGPPWPVADPFDAGREHHVEVTLKQTKGSDD